MERESNKPVDRGVLRGSCCSCCFELCDFWSQCSFERSSPVALDAVVVKTLDPPKSNGSSPDPSVDGDWNDVVGVMLVFAARSGGGDAIVSTRGDGAGLSKPLFEGSNNNFLEYFPLGALLGIARCELGGIGVVMFVVAVVVGGAVDVVVAAVADIAVTDVAGTNVVADVVPDVDTPGAVVVTIAPSGENEGDAICGFGGAGCFPDRVFVCGVAGPVCVPRGGWRIFSAW